MNSRDQGNGIGRRSFLGALASSAAGLGAAAAPAAATAKDPIIDTHMHVWSGDLEHFPFAHPGERNLKPPVISLSFGDTGLFQIGGLTKNVPLEDIYLESGDCIVLSGESRLFFHKFTRLLPGTSSDLARGGRLNITIRQVF